jgi:hypothetical protein
MKYFFICGLLLIYFASPGQQKYGVIHFYAYFSEQGHGNSLVDKEGITIDKGPDTLYRVYAETVQSRSPVDWKLAWVNGRTYTVITKFIGKTAVEIGFNQSSQEKIIVKPSGGNYLWSLQLLPIAKATTAPQKINPGEIILQGQFKNKRVLEKINKLVNLRLPPVQ